jgi:DNA-binding winged helix-turn-helix (wHTH) protein
VQKPEDDLRQAGTPFRLGDWLVEPELNRVSRGGSSYQLALKVMYVLVFLAEHAGTTVPKHRIIDAVWRTEFITENTLTQAIADLRRVMGDNARDPQFIETITKRGYRLIADVEILDDAAPITPTTGLPCALVVDRQESALVAGDNLIGRATDAVVLLDSEEVSRHHAVVRVSMDSATLEDLGSKNGTLLWGSRVGSPTPLKDGDEIAIGPVVLTFRVLSSLATTRSARSVDTRIE